MGRWGEEGFTCALAFYFILYLYPASLLIFYPSPPFLPSFYSSNNPFTCILVYPTAASHSSSSKKTAYLKVNEQLIQLTRKNNPYLPRKHLPKYYACKVPALTTHLPPLLPRYHTSFYHEHNMIVPDSCLLSSPPLSSPLSRNKNISTVGITSTITPRRAHTHSPNIYLRSTSNFNTNLTTLTPPPQQQTNHRNFLPSFLYRKHRFLPAMQFCCKIIRIPVPLSFFCFLFFSTCNKYLYERYLYHIGVLCGAGINCGIVPLSYLWVRYGT